MPNLIYEHYPTWTHVKNGDFLHLKFQKILGDRVSFRFRSGDLVSFKQGQVDRVGILHPNETYLFRIEIDYKKLKVQSLTPIFNTTHQYFLSRDEWNNRAQAEDKSPWRGVQVFE